MTKALPYWLLVKYAELWRTFKGKPFDFEQAAKTLGLKSNRGLLSLGLSELKSAGWLSAEIKYDDSRKRVYTLKSPEQGIAELTEKEGVKSHGKARKSTVRTGFTGRKPRKRL